MISLPRYLALAVLALLAACAAMHPPAPNLPPRTSITPGRTITVDGEQTVYSVARDNNVSMREIIVLNNLQPPFSLHPGQSLVLPEGAYAQDKGMPPPPMAAPSSVIEQRPLSTIEAVPLPPPPMPPKQQQSSFTPPPVPPAAVASTATPASVQASTVQVMPVASTAPTPITAASPPPPAPAAQPAAEPATIPETSMQWPVQGPVLSGFGPKGQGLNNDGINLGAPKGTPVVAAQNGVVVYAGNQMKGFGNLVLIRHQNGWVTAYAHLDRIVVTKDSVVAQGDMIGTVGKTGNVPTPQLHFETRYQGKPVDPASVIKP